MHGVEADAKLTFRITEQGEVDGVRTVRRSFCRFSSRKGYFFSLFAHFVGLKFNRMGAG